MWHGGPNLPDQLCGCGFSHEFTGNIDGGDGGIDNAPFGDIVESCDGDVLRNFVATEFQGFDGSDSDEIVICKICTCQRSSAVYNLQHV